MRLASTVVSGAEVDLRAVGFSHGPRTVLADVTVTVGAGSRLAVVGPNGVGKSTLLGLAAGDLSPESGTVVVSPPSATGDPGRPCAATCRDAPASPRRIAR